MNSRGTVAVTDFGWYEFLNRRSLEEVNFWTPSDRRTFAAAPFSPFFFKLKAPHRAIAGFGYFAKWSSLPPWLAWECFGEGNGCGSGAALEERLESIRQRIRFVGDRRRANIGCILIVQPTFFPRDAWIPQPYDWHDRTVSSEAYDLTVGEGKRIWEACQDRVVDVHRSPPRQLPQVAGPLGPRYGTPRILSPRLGQGTFRISVLDAYARACAVTGEHSLPALEAAHIRAYDRDGPHLVSNGLLLRADLHRLFDKGYLTVNEDHKLEVSPRLRADYNNGRAYYPLHGRELQLPRDAADRPAGEYLAWHRENVYLGDAV